jgi:hypothetical protein
MPLRPVLLLLAVLGGWAATAGLVAAAGVSVVEPGWRTRLVVLLTVAAAAAGAAVALLARRRPAAAAEAGVVAAGVLLGAAGTAALHGTRWGWYGLYSDSSFRTQMATRYAETPALVDYGYRDLPAYYPPALGWLQGRLAAVTELAGWEAVKPVQLLVGVLVPLAAYLLWRPVVGALPGAAVAGLVTVWTAHPQKPDEWLVLSCLLPWWLLTVRDVRAPGVARWPAWRLGVVLGLLLLVHTYWFLPFGVATLLALGYDAVRARRGAAGRRGRRRRGTSARRPGPALPGEDHDHRHDQVAQVRHASNQPSSVAMYDTRCIGRSPLTNAGFSRRRTCIAPVPQRSRCSSTAWRRPPRAHGRAPRCGRRCATPLGAAGCWCGCPR